MMTNEVLAFCDESFALKCPDILCSLKWAWNSSSSRCIFCHDCTVCCIILIIPAPRLLQWQHCNIPLLLLPSGHYKVIIRCVNKPNGLQIQKKVTEKHRLIGKLKLISMIWDWQQSGGGRGRVWWVAADSQYLPGRGLHHTAANKYFLPPLKYFCNFIDGGIVGEVRKLHLKLLGRVVRWIWSL